MDQRFPQIPRKPVSKAKGVLSSTEKQRLNPEVDIHHQPVSSFKRSPLQKISSQPSLGPSGIATMQLRKRTRQLILGVGTLKDMGKHNHHMVKTRKGREENVLAHLRSEARTAAGARGAARSKAEGKRGVVGGGTTKLCFFLSGTQGKRHFLVRSWLLSRTFYQGSSRCVETGVQRSDLTHDYRTYLMHNQVSLMSPGTELHSACIPACMPLPKCCYGDPLGHESSLAP
ncbi:uncharacterized protein LOC113480505 [Athene cunicularia]|uniref:uncharacterized protein LOC113480505 n=1 Tax=Athene cunicularia TaxID=194338 RepID=UPI000EF66A22|nr:uncharacterized protein LOC113480505 [Athene cunicularia]